MDSLLGRLAALDAARLVAVAAALLTLLVVAAWILGTVNGRWDSGVVGGAVVAVLLAAIGLLYAFELGTPSASV